MTSVTAPSNYIEHFAAILRAPEDDAPRLALANFVERSDPDLTAFIQLQIARAQRERRPNAAGLVEWTDDERRLLARNAAEWTRLVTPYVSKTPRGGLACTFHRGLIAHVVVDPEVFVEHAEALLVRAPIRHVDFAPLRPGVLSTLLASAALARLDSFGFSGVGLDDDAVAAIAACPQLASCLYLDLSKNPLGPRAFAALAASPHLRRLLVVERAQEPGLDAASTWHPGEVVATENSAAGLKATLIDMRAEGRTLEASHGYLPWLHLDNRVSRFDARWFVDQGLRPVLPAGANLTATPLVWEHTGDGEFPFRARHGGKTLTIRVNDFPAEPLYTLLVDGAEHEDLDDWPAAWTAPPTPQRLIDLAAHPAREPNTMSAALLRQWSEQLCRASGTPAELARALGIVGAVVDQGRDYATVEPPPPGATELVLMKDGTGTVDQIHVLLAMRQRVRSLELEAQFGTGDPIPRGGPDHPYSLAYHVEVAGAEDTCEVFASFNPDEVPAPTSIASEVVLRRDHVIPRIGASVPGSGDPDP